MSTSPLSELIDQARRERWCTKRECATCDPAAWRSAVSDIAATPPQLADMLERLPLDAWYDLPEFGGAIWHCFAALRDDALVDRVLAAWLDRLDGHYRIADAVTFYIIRDHQASDRMSADWLARAEAMAVESDDPSLLETLVYAFGRQVAEHPALLRAAERARGGHAPLDRALKRTTEITATERVERRR